MEFFRTEHGRVSRPVALLLGIDKTQVSTSFCEISEKSNLLETSTSFKNCSGFPKKTLFRLRDSATCVKYSLNVFAICFLFVMSTPFATSFSSQVLSTLTFSTFLLSYLYASRYSQQYIYVLPF